MIGSDARLSLTWKKEIIKIPGRLSDLTAMNKQMVGYTCIYLLILSSREEDKRGRKSIR